MNGERLLENTLAGFEIKPKKPVKDPDHSTWIDPGAIQYATELLPDSYNWQDFQSTDLQGKAAWEAVKQTIVANAARDQLLQTLGWVNPEMDFGQPANQGVLVTA